MQKQEAIYKVQVEELTKLNEGDKKLYETRFANLEKKHKEMEQSQTRKDAEYSSFVIT
jgi:hypothetical protein